MLEFLRKHLFLLSISILIIIYTVGITLIITTDANSKIVELTPFTILLTTFLLLLNQNQWTINIIYSLVAVFLLGLLIEIIGVNTGFPFGEYSYSEILGIHIFQTPILIGINWLMLVYAAVLTLHTYMLNVWKKAVLAGLILVSLDVFIEPVAIGWGMWTWKTSSVPIQNYVTWGLAAIIFSLILSWKLEKTDSNKMAPVVLMLQFIFFVILGLCG